MGLSERSNWQLNAVVTSQLGAVLRSTSNTLWPDLAAVSAAPTPTMPPPRTAISYIVSKGFMQRVPCLRLCLWQLAAPVHLRRSREIRYTGCPENGFLCLDAILECPVKSVPRPERASRPDLWLPGR